MLTSPMLLFPALAFTLNFKLAKAAIYVIFPLTDILNIPHPKLNFWFFPLRSCSTHNILFLFILTHVFPFLRALFKHDLIYLSIWRAERKEQKKHEEQEEEEEEEGRRAEKNKEGRRAWFFSIRGLLSQMATPSLCQAEARSQDLCLGSDAN